ncbi:hypothetical protein SteCoe_33997 [Stentor coeruleus]|uniref:LITAF domain-containing protein n=1 Tax=Stentor coeruleus TaxID=5963 RepID=A0A1R2AVF1_9CILI|nr:hypothetical protein SteCoe_33997 [Stentor coeruleus]
MASGLLNLSNNTSYERSQKHLILFPNSCTKSASPISEKRYNRGNSIFEKSDDASENSDTEIQHCKRLLLYNTSKINDKNNKRPKSIAELDDILQFIEKKDQSNRKSGKSCMDYEFKQSSHRRNISDADSVIYMCSDEEKYLSDYKSQPPFILADMRNRNSLPILEGAPCTAYCRYCKKDVHTIVEIHNTHLSNGVLRIFSSIFSCCSLPNWLRNARVHKCPNCSLVIAKCK